MMNVGGSNSLNIMKIGIDSQPAVKKPVHVANFLQICGNLTKWTALY